MNFLGDPEQDLSLAQSLCFPFPETQGPTWFLAVNHGEEHGIISGSCRINMPSKHCLWPEKTVCPELTCKLDPQLYADAFVMNKFIKKCY